MPSDNETPPVYHVPSPDGHGSGVGRKSTRRSRSRIRRDSRGYRSRSRPSADRRVRDRSLHERELELQRQRQRLHDLETKLRRDRKEHSRLTSREKTRDRSHRREQYSHEEDLQRLRERRDRRLRTPEARQSQHARDSRNNVPAAAAPQSKRSEAQQSKRSDSPTFTVNDVMKIINSLGHNKPKPQVQPSTVVTPMQSNNNINPKNILPDFDPSSKSQRIDIWIKKVNECATVYGWDERTVIHFAMQKLQGLAKTWYESLNSILFSWAEWQQKLLNAFPFEQNYGQSLEDMLKRRSRYNEPLEVYYYEKLALLNRCDIEGKRAVDCIIHGLNDKTMRSSANALRCTQPDQLLQFLMSNKEVTQPFDRNNFKGKQNDFNHRTTNKPMGTGINEGLFCFNCKEKGHPYLKCPKPLIQCDKCRRFGHKADKCMAKSQNSNTYNNRDNDLNASKTMRIFTTGSSSKFIKDVRVNNILIKSFIDFGSEVTLLSKSASLSLGLVSDNRPTPLKGFGNDIIYSFGGVEINLDIDGVEAKVLCQVVDDKFLDMPLLVGQSFTEQSHIAVYKNAKHLSFFNMNNELPFLNNYDEENMGLVVSIAADIDVHGPAVVKAYTNSGLDGDILLYGRVIGKPTQQFMIEGGVYKVKDGQFYVQVTPLHRFGQLCQGSVVARGTRVQVVNRVCAIRSESKVDSNEIDSDQVRIGNTIDGYHRQKLLAMLKRYKHCFATSLQELGCTNVTEMSIELNSKRPVVYRPYRLSHKERERVREMVGEMLEAGIVRESVSEYASPIILVRKKDGSQRLCVDYRLLNSVTIKERYPMPVIEDEIARLSGQAYFITLDLCSGYYQVPIAEDSKQLTSFVTPDGQYEFNRMPFGLANAPAVFQRMMNRVLGSARFTEATAYIDDILIYGKNVNECLERLERVLRLIEQANLTLNLPKCNFLQNKINYLGYEISSEGVRPGDKKVQSVIDFPCPTNIHTVRQFLGLVGYFRKFVRNFAALAHPLNKLLKKDMEWVWSEEQEAAFKALKDVLVHRPILAIYDPSAMTELHTDASRVGIAGILLQRSNANESFRPVAYYSRQTSPEEKNFHAFELETLAVVCSLKKFRVYLLGQNFKIVTDCSALRSTFSKRDLIPRIARWWLVLQEFQCSVEYRAGTKMTHVDALSRNPIKAHSDTNETDQYPSVMSISNQDWLQTLQMGDSELCRIRDILTTNLDAEGLSYIKENYLIKDNKLYRIIDGDNTNLRWVVPKGARWQLCRMNHDEIGHFGVEKTLERIRKTYWFPKMSRFVKKYVQACIECAYAKKVNSNEGQLHTITKVEVPFHTLHIDHLGPFVRSKRGNTYLLVIIDAFTKFIFIRPVRNTKSQTAIRVLEDIFFTFRNPDRIISDRGTCFTSHAFRHFCLDKGIRHILNSVASPRSNGQVERYNRTIISSLTAQNLNSNEKDWDDKVGVIQWGMNNTCQKTTGRAPAEVMFGSSMNAEVDPRMNELVQEACENTDIVTIRETVKDRIDVEQEKQKKAYDKTRRPARLYSEGDLVKITRTAFTNDGKSKKLLSPYIGPYRVVAVLGNDRYRLAAIPGLSGTRNKRKTTVAADRMLPWVHVAALDVNEDNSDDNSTDKSDSEI